MSPDFAGKRVFYQYVRSGKNIRKKHRDLQIFRAARAGNLLRKTNAMSKEKCEKLDLEQLFHM